MHAHTVILLQPSVKSGEQSVIISLEDESVKYLSGYIINGINLFPATGYLVSCNIINFINL
jgi:hypothetical protein